MTSLIITTVKLSCGFLRFPSSISSRQAPVSLKSCSPSSPVSHTGQKTPREHSVVPNRGIFLIQFLRVKIMLPLLLEKRFMVHLNFNVKILLFERREKKRHQVIKVHKRKQKWKSPKMSRTRQKHIFVHLGISRTHAHPRIQGGKWQETQQMGFSGLDQPKWSF